MSLFEKIACLADPYDVDHSSLNMAMEFWKGNSKKAGGLSVFSANTKASVPSSDNPEIMDSHTKTDENWLSKWLVNEVSDNTVLGKVLESGEPSRELVAFEHQLKTTMLVESGGKRAPDGSKFLSDFKLNMLRFSPAPVYLVQENAARQGRCVILAMNVASEDDRFMRDMHKYMMRRAMELASFYNSEVHLVNAVRPVTGTYPGYMAALSPDLIGQAVITECRKNLLDFASHYDLPQSRCHVLDGTPEEMIPEMCQTLTPSVLVMASSGRSGIAGSIIGNVPETIMRRVDCDLLVIPSKCLKYQTMD